MLNNYDLSKIFLPGKRIFFAGVGGVSMSALCHLCFEKGIFVSGYDAASGPLTQMLSARGIQITHAFSESLFAGVDAVVYTAAIPMEDRILSHPASLGIPLIPRAKALGFLSQEKPRRIGVSGTHGKSTTTGMLAKIFLDAGRDPMVLEGAPMPELEGTLHYGKGTDLIFEACEYRDSFLDFLPTISVVLDVEHDHVDYFDTPQAMVDSFVRYANLPGESGLCIINIDTKLAKDVSKRVDIPMLTLSESADADYRARDIRLKNGAACFQVIAHGVPYTEVSLAVPGAFQVANALAAVAAADACGIPAAQISASLAAFGGVERRFQRRGTLHNIPVVDDYAHHPSEIAATLDAAKACGYRDIVCVFQPHTFTRTKAFWKDFTTVFAPCKKVIFADIYPAREAPLSGIDARALAKDTENGVYAGDFGEICAYLDKECGADLFLIMGAGDIVALTDCLLAMEDA